VVLFDVFVVVVVRLFVLVLHDSVLFSWPAVLPAGAGERLRPTTGPKDADSLQSSWRGSGSAGDAFHLYEGVPRTPFVTNDVCVWPPEASVGAAFNAPELS
jgi:hypothetical protein